MVPTAGVSRKLAYEMDHNELKKTLAKTTNENDRYDLLLEIYKKISLPLSSLAFIILTVPLGVRRKVEGKFSGTLYSLLLFIFYYVLMAMTDSLGKNIHAPPYLVTFLPNAVILGMGLYLVRSLNKEEHVTISQRLKYLWVYVLKKLNITFVQAIKYLLIAQLAGVTVSGHRVLQIRDVLPSRCTHS